MTERVVMQRVECDNDQAEFVTTRAVIEAAKADVPISVKWLEERLPELAREYGAEMLCEWSGDIDVTLSGNYSYWTCPACGYEHVTDMAEAWAEMKTDEQRNRDKERY